MDSSVKLDAFLTLSPKLRNFRRKSSSLYNFSCPICGDSKKNTLAARGYVFMEKGDWLYKCHNCGEAMNLSGLIRFLDPDTYAKMQLDRFRETGSPEPISEPEDRIITKLSGSMVFAINDLPDVHPAVKYLRSRCLTPDITKDLFWAQDISTLVSKTSDPDRKFKFLNRHEGRVLIPMRRKDGTIYAVSLRSIDPDAGLRYIHVKLDRSEPDMVFGLDRVQPHRRIYVFEGQFDSLFVPNAIAASGAALLNVPVRFPGSKLTFVFDNEPRNAEIVNLIHRTICDGHDVCLFPEGLAKDVNEMVLQGQVPAANVKKLIDTNTVSGLNAELKFRTWKRI